MKHFFQNRKLWIKLMKSYLFVCLAPIIVISGILNYVAIKSVKSTSQELASAFASQIVSSMNQFLEEYDRLTKSVVVDNEILSILDNDEKISVVDAVNRRTEMRKMMNRLIILKPDIKNVGFLTEKGKLYQFGTNADNMELEQLTKQKWLGDIRNSKVPVVVTAVHDRSYYDNNQDGVVITIGRKVLNQSGVYVGMLLIDIEPSSLIKLSDEFLLTRDRYNIRISITDKNGGMVYDSNVASGKMTWTEAMGQGADFVHFQEGKNLIIAKNTVEDELSVRILIPESLYSLNQSRIYIVTITAVTAITIIIFGVSYYLSRRIMKPILKVQEGMQYMENGQYRLLDIKSDTDEIENLIVIYNAMVKQIKNLIEKVYISQIKEKNAEYLALQTQINPHMLYNTLESIRMKALVDGNQQVADMIKILAKMFRLALDIDGSSWKIRNEVEYILTYVQLQNIRYKDEFALELDLSEEIMNTPVIPMILQPIVENSINHGYRGYGKRLHIKIRGEAKASATVRLVISDDGRGMSPERKEQVNKMIQQLSADDITLDFGSGSIGLVNIAERIRLYYGETYQLLVSESTEKGTVVTISIPFVDDGGENGISDNHCG